MKELFFELGMEELPARLVRRALKDLQTSIEIGKWVSASIQKLHAF